MDRFFVFLVIAVVTSPSEMKTMEEMENQLDFLMKKMESIEANADAKTVEMEAKISTLENKSSYCAYQNDWYSDNGRVIVYDSLLVDDTNIDGASFNLATGQFTAGIAGVYSVQFSIGTLNDWHIYGKDTEIYLRLNGVNIDESRVYHTNFDGDSEIGGRSMLLNMARGDKLDAYGEQMVNILDVTFCISLT